MKKRITLIITCAMMVLLTACGASEGKETPDPTREAEPTATTALTPEPTATTAPAQEDTYEKGVITAEGYESKWINLRFTTQADMHMLTQEELDATMKQSLDKVYGDNAEALLDYASMTTVTEMMAQSVNGANVIVQVERLSRIYETMTEEEYLSTVLANLQSAAKEITTEEELYTLELGGETYLGISTGSDYNTGVIVYQEFLVRKKEDRMISVIVSYADYSVESAQNFLASFGAYDSEPIILEQSTKEPSTNGGSFDVGSWNGSVYENQWLGFRFTVPEGVEYTASEIADIVAIEATWEQGLPIVQIMVEKAVYDGMTAEAYAGALKQALSAMADSGITYTFDETMYVAEVAGQEYLNLATNAESMGAKLYQDYLLREKDGYIIAIIITYADGFESYLQGALDAFTVY